MMRDFKFLKITDSLRWSSEAGIAIAPVLFVIAILGLIAALISSNIGSYGSAGVIDRIAADIPSQAGLIQQKINECNLKYGGFQNVVSNNIVVGTIYVPVYPTAGTNNLVAYLNCPNDPAGSQNLWTGQRPALYPQPTTGFAAWNYTRNLTGGTCIYTSPTGVTNPANVPNIVEGLNRAAKKFSNQRTCNNTSTACTSEVMYDPSSASQKFVLWISMPTTGSAPDPTCLP